MINLEFKGVHGERIAMAYDVTAEENRSLTIPAGAVAIQVWLGTLPFTEEEWMNQPCQECVEGNHEACRDGTRISAVPYTCECAMRRHSE